MRLQESRLLASTASMKAYIAEITGLKIALFDVRHSKVKLEGKYSGLQSSLCQLQ
jgi:hypothetical protein